MKITNKQYIVFAGLFQLIIAIAYTLICISNYTFDWLEYESVRDLSEYEILKINSKRNYDPNMTWGLAGFNGIMFIVYCILWKENKTDKKTDFIRDIISFGSFPFLFALIMYYMIDYKNSLILVITGSYAAASPALYISHKIDNNQEESKKY